MESKEVSGTETYENDLIFQHRTSSLVTQDEPAYKSNFYSCFLRIAEASFISFLCHTFKYLLVITGVVCVTQLDDETETAAIGLASTTLLVLFFYPVSGNLGALDTLVTTAYGSKQYYLCGVYLNRAILIQLMFSIP